MGKYLRACRDMVPFSIRLLKPAELVVIYILCFLYTSMLMQYTSDSMIDWNMFVDMGAIIMLSADSFLDYFSFAGISSRKQPIAMNLIRVANNSEDFIKKSLIGEMLFRAGWAVLIISPIGIMIGISPDSSSTFSVIASIITLIFLEVGIVNFILILTRRVGLNMQTHMMLSFTLGSIGSVILLLAFIWINKVDSMMLSGIFIVFSMLFVAVSAVILINDNCKGFRCGFFDNEKE